MWDTISAWFAPAPAQEAPDAAYPEYTFQPTVTFFSNRFQSEYVKDLTYTVRPGNDRLNENVKQWIAQNKVRVQGEPWP